MTASASGKARSGRTALICGSGRLGAALAARLDEPVLAALEGFAPDGLAVETFRLERLVPFLDSLLDRGVTQMAFVGAVRRPPLDPELFDRRTAMLVPRMAAAMQQGDDALLRQVIAVVEEAGLDVIGLADLAPDMVPAAGIITGHPTPRDEGDASRAAAIVAGLGVLDIGQGAVVSAGLCLAVETLPGTEPMLDFVRQTRSGQGGVLWKAPKPGQERRIDLPAVGPDTVKQAVAAGLSGIAWEAGGVVLIDRDETIAAADAAGLFLWARDVHQPDPCASS